MVHYDKIGLYTGIIIATTYAYAKAETLADVGSEFFKPTPLITVAVLYALGHVVDRVKRVSKYPKFPRTLEQRV